MKKLENFFIGALLVFFIWYNPTPFQILELKTFDWLMSTQESVQDQMIVLVDIDEAIVEAYRGYPLPRDLYASLMERTPAIPGITVLMPDPDLRDPRNDFILQNTLIDVPSVLAYAASTQASEGGPHVGTAQIGEDLSLIHI